MVLHITDASPRVKGDGILAGFTRTNDGQCHMLDSDSGLDTIADKMDIPSFGNCSKECKSMLTMFSRSNYSSSNREAGCRNFCSY